MKEESKENNKLIYNKIQLPPHHYITLELLVKRKFLVNVDDVELFMFDALFEEVLQSYDFKTVLIVSSYIIAKVKLQKYRNYEGEEIKNLYGYFRHSLLWNLKRITGQIRLSWEEDDDDYG